MNTEPFKKRLEEEKLRLETEMSSVGRKNPAEKGDWEAVPQDVTLESDPNDLATEMQGYGDNAAILNDLELRYADVNAALARIDAGTYGTCDVGGEAIESARLEADPAAHTCVAHK